MSLKVFVTDINEVPDYLQAEYVAEDPNDPSKGYRLLFEDDKATPEQKAANKKIRDFRDNNTKLLKENQANAQKLDEFQRKIKELEAKISAGASSNVPPAGQPAQRPDEDDAAFQARIRPYREQMEAETKRLRDALQSTSQEKENLAKRVEDTRKDTEIRQSLGNADLRVQDEIAYNMLAEHVKKHMVIEKDGRTLFRDPITNQLMYSPKNATEPMSTTEFLGEAMRKMPYLFVQGQGGGASGSRTGVSAAVHNSAVLGRSVPFTNQAMIANLTEIAKGRVKVDR